MHTETHDCCKTNHSAHGHHGNRSSALHAAAYATLHCLVGCVIGELAGLSIGVTLGLHPYATMALSTMLAYISGFALSIFPLMRRTRLPFAKAIQAIWIGEAVSIGVMEIVMNTVDYHMGGMGVSSISNPLFWQGLAVAVPAGYIAALPVNFWLIGRQLKKCH
jgi:hypothetical protein